MLKLTYVVVNKRGVTRHEALFVSGEKRTAVELARDLRERGDKCRDVVLTDFSLVKGEVVTVLPADPDNELKTGSRLAPVEVSRVSCKVPACVVVDLSKLPRASRAKAPTAKAKANAGVGVKADAFDLPKPKRVSKRVRQFGADSPRVVAALES